MLCLFAASCYMKYVCYIIVYVVREVRVEEKVIKVMPFIVRGQVRRLFKHRLGGNIPTLLFAFNNVRLMCLQVVTNEHVMLLKSGGVVCYIKS